jgi:phosphate-selective porin OprO/OprP
MNAKKMKWIYWVSLISLSAFADTSGPFEPLQWDSGIIFRDPEEQYRAQLRFRMQNLVEYTTQSSSDLGAARIDAQVRRMRLRLQGFVADPRLTFQLQLSFSRSDQDFSTTQFANVVRDANVGYSLIQESDQILLISFGQAKLPGNRQRVVSSGDLQFADRSIVNRTFNIDRDFGFQTMYQRSHWNIRAAVATGEGRNLTQSSNSGLVYVGRVEGLPFGPFSGNNDYTEGAFKPEPDARLSLGYSYAWFKDSNRANGSIGTVYTTTGSPLSGSPIRRDQGVHWVDGLLKINHFSLYSEFAYRHSSEGRIDATRALFEGHGYLFQAGQMVGQKIEIVGRYARVEPLARSEIDSSNRLIRQATGGVNYYLKGHRVKFQTDLTREWSSTPAWLARFNVELGI